MPRYLPLTLISIFSAAAILYLLSRPLPPPLSPRSPIILPQVSSPSKPLVIGFLPHWNIAKLSDPALATTTHLAYFSLKLGGNGHLIKRVNPREEEPGWTVYKRLPSRLTQKPLILVISQADNKEIDSLLQDEKNWQNAINTILDLASVASGINLDIEPSGQITPEKRQAFTSFVAHLSEALKKQHPSVSLSLDIYPSAASKLRLWDLEKLEPVVDHFIVMTYDYHRASSALAGPNAPLRGAPDLFDEDVIKNLKELIKVIPPGKLILGVPFYGYQWYTEGDTKYAATVRTGAVASLDRVESLIKEKNLQPRWDDKALAPYLVIRENERIAQVYYENDVSLRLKLDLAKSTGLGGVAIWALGYESPSASLWETLANYQR